MKSLLSLLQSATRFLAVSSLVGISSEAPAAEFAPLSTTSAVLDMVGVNAHLAGDRSNPYRYPDVALVEKALKYVGIKKLRSGISIGLVDPRWAYQAVPMNKIAADGYRFNIPVYPFGENQKASLRAFMKAYPGSIISIEGPNEINQWPVETTKSFQNSLYSFVHSEPTLAAVPVINWSLAYASPKAYRPYGDVSSTADLGNCHSYAGVSAPATSWAYYLSACGSVTPNRPMVITEVGWTTLTSVGVSEAAQAKSILNMVMDATKTKVKETYIYELLDRNVPHTKSPKENSFGIFHADGTPKPAADALHNLHTILSTSAERNAILQPADCSVKGGQGVQAFLLQKKARHYVLVLWAEPKYWDPAQHADIPVPEQKISVSIPDARSASVFDPLRSATAISKVEKPDVLAIAVSDHPVLIEFMTDRTKH